jgi:hypothetical protein
MPDKNLKLKSILQNKEAEAESRGNKINWDNTDFSDSDGSATSTETRAMLDKALKSGDKNMISFWSRKLRGETDAFGKE